MGSTSARPVAVDLFSGAGGLSLGFEQAGFDVVAAVEYDPIHAVTHMFNFPDCEVLCRDVRAITRTDLEDAARRGAAKRGRALGGRPIDVIFGGPSCQGFSAIGKRDDDDYRNDLLNEFARLVLEVRPRAFVFENVPGLLEPRFESLRKRLWAKYRAAGYELSGTDSHLDAREFGVPQVRRRVFVVGIRDGAEASFEPLRAEHDITVREAFDGLPEVEGYDRLLRRDDVRLSLSDTARRRSATSLYARSLSGLVANTDLGRPRISDGLVHTGGLRTVHTSLTVDRFASTLPGDVEPKSRLFRLDLDAHARTLRAGTGRERGAHTSPRPIHPTLPRVITVREAARLHGYPDWFRFNSTNWHGHRQIGNSVPPPFGRAVGDAVRAMLGVRPRRLTAPLALGDPALLSLRPAEAAALVGARENEVPAQRLRKAV